MTAMLIRCLWLLDVTRRLGACRKGNTAIEFALTAPLLVLLAFGAFDYGSAYVEGVRLNGASRAGAQQALYNAQDWQNTDQMEQAALEEYVGHALTPEEVAVMSVSATAEAFCACTAGATLVCMSIVTTLPGLLSGLQVTAADVVPVVRSANCARPWSRAVPWSRRRRSRSRARTQSAPFP